MRIPQLLPALPWGVQDLVEETAEGQPKGQIQVLGHLSPRQSRAAEDNSSPSLTRGGRKGGERGR